MIRLHMESFGTTTRSQGRPITTGLGPSLLLAVAIMVLASGSVSSARTLGSAGVGLAMTVLAERSSRNSQPQGFDAAEQSSSTRAVAHAVQDLQWVAGGSANSLVRAGLIDLPPPATF